MIMSNVEKLKEMINKLAECHISSEYSIPAYLASIATSLAVIADKMAEPLNEEISKEEQTDGDLISRKEVEKCCLDGWNKDYKDILEDIRKLPSSEKTAEWIKQKSGDELFPEEIVCSKCYHSNSHLDFDEHNNPIGKLFLKSKYCPNCGAKMKGGN